MTEKSISHMRRAVNKLGSQAALAEAVGVTQGMVSFWCRDVHPVSWDFARKIEEVTGGEVSRNDLRPDIFGPSDSAA